MRFAHLRLWKCSPENRKLLCALSSKMYVNFVDMLFDVGSCIGFSLIFWPSRFTNKTYFNCLVWINAAMLVYKTVSGNKSFKKLVHLSLQFLAFCFSLIGVWAAFKFHVDKGIDNFYSLHSWLGLACLFLFGIQVSPLTPPCIYFFSRTIIF